MVGKQNGMWRLAAVVISLSVGVACGKSKTPTSPSGSANAVASATQVGIAAQGIAIDGQYTMNVGDRLQVSAMVTMSDGAREDRTATATWTSENPAIATAAGGLITALAAGQTVVTARYDQVLARLTVTVRGGGDGGPGGPGNGGGGNRTVSHIEIEGAPSVGIGRGTPLALVAYFSDGSRETITNGATWSVSPSSMATVRDGQLWGIESGTVTVTAGYDGHTDTHSAQVMATAVSVSSVSVAGNTATTVGGSTQLVAMARLSDGTQQSTTTLAQWESSNPGVATVADGLVRGVSVGSTVVTARINGVAGQATVTVSSAGPNPGPGGATVTSLVLSGSLSVGAGATSQLTAMANLSDGTQQNVTASAQWSSANGGVATVVGGLVSGVSAGSTAVSAQYQGISQQATVQVTGGGGGTPTLVNVTVQGGVSVVTGQTVQLTATANFSNGSTQNVTASATWSSSAPAILTVNGGLVSGVAAGAATVSASYQGQTASVQFSVTGGSGPTPPPTVVSVAVNGNVSIGIGVSSQLTVLATLSNNTVIDVTALATYQSSNPLFVSVSAAGRLTGLLAGLANVTATYQGVSATVQVTITVTLPVVNGLTINGASTVKLLQLINLTAVASLSDGTQQTVTEGCQWSSSNLGILDFITNGVLRALLVGNVTVTANYQGRTATKTITVTLL